MSSNPYDYQELVLLHYNFVYFVVLVSVMQAPDYVLLVTKISGKFLFLSYNK